MHGATFVDLDGDGLIDSLIATGGMQSVSDLPVPGANQAFKSGDHGMSDPQYPHANDAVLLFFCMSETRLFQSSCMNLDPPKDARNTSGSETRALSLALAPLARPTESLSAGLAVWSKLSSWMISQ